MSSNSREARELVRKLRRAGWDVTMTGSGHYKCKPPDGVGFVTMALSPSDSRSLPNAVARLRKYGLPRDVV